jgi:hypothetical protein
LECDYFDLTSTRGAGVGERFGRFRFRAGELVLADAGYSHAAGIAEVVAAKADVCVRINPYSLPLFDQRGHTFPLRKHLSRVRKTNAAVSWTVRIRSGEQWIQGRVCAIRKSRQAIEQAQRRLTRKRQKGKVVSGPEARKYAEYVILFTTLPEADANADQVLQAYRLRWQVELVFKRLKSILHFGHVPKYDDQSCRAWLYGKILVALLTQKLIQVGKTISPWGYLIPQNTDSQPLA